MRHALQFVAITVIAVLTACAHVSKEKEYVRPTGVPPESLAIVTGSEVIDPSALNPDTRLYVVSIDGKLTMTGPKGWGERIPVLPGEHDLQIGAARQSIFDDTFGSNSFHLNLEPGRTYAIRGDQPKQSGSDLKQVECWLEDDRGTKFDSVFVSLYPPIGGHGEYIIPVGKVYVPMVY